MTQERLYEIYAQFAKFFKEILEKQKNKFAYDSLIKLGLTDKTIEKFSLGYSSGDAQIMIKYASEHGISEDELQDAKLLKTVGNRIEVFFNNRIMIPICDENGNVVSFCGREVKRSGALYLKFPGNHLFAINFAKDTKEDNIVLREGFLDTLLSYENGKDNEIGYLRFDEGHAKILSKYTKSVTIIQNPDEYGQKNAENVCKILNSTGLEAHIQNP